MGVGAEEKKKRGSVFAEFKSHGVDNYELQRRKMSTRGDQVPLNSAGHTDNMDEEKSEERR